MQPDFPLPPTPPPTGEGCDLALAGARGEGKRKTWGLVLSGGAAYGLANAGVLEVLEREGLTPDYIAGSSMGAIVGSIAALGHSVKDLRSLQEELLMSNVARLSEAPFAGGLHGGLLQQSLEDHLRELIGDARIGDCRIPFLCVAGRVQKPLRWMNIFFRGFHIHAKERIAFHIFDNDTKIIDAIMASSAIPVVFSPVKIGNDTFVDLCHFGSVPARTMRRTFQPDIVIATDTNPWWDPKKWPGGWGEFIAEGQKEIDKSLGVCDLIIRPEPAASVFRFDQMQAFWEAGKRAAE